MTHNGDSDTKQHNRTAVIIFNPIKADEQIIKDKAQAAANRHDWGQVEFRETTEEDPGSGMAQEAAETGADMVIACGGDGTIRAVASGLRNTDCALGIVPLGTGNLLARNLEIPLDPSGAIETAFSGTTAAMDMCTAEVVRPGKEETESIDFLIMAGVGIDAGMIRHTDDDLKKRIGALAYVLGLIRSLRNGNQLTLSYSFDGEPNKTAKVHSVIVGNCGNLQANFSLFPDADYTDGLIDVLTMRPDDAGGWVTIAGHLIRQMADKLTRRWRKADGSITEEKPQLEQLTYRTGSEFKAEFDRPEPFEIDGEEIGEVIGFSITVDRQSLSVRVPK